jgi:hypothetical protein
LQWISMNWWGETPEPRCLAPQAEFELWFHSALLVSQRQG